MNWLMALVEGWIAQVTKAPRLTITASMALILLVLSGAGGFKLDASPDSLLLEDDPDLRAVREQLQQYGFGDFLIVTFRPDSDLFGEASLDSLRALVEDLQTIPRVTGVVSLLDGIVFPSGDVSLSTALEGMRSIGEGVPAEEARKAMLDSPLFRELIVDEKGEVSALQVNIEAFSHTLPDYYRERYRLRDDEGDRSDELATLEAKISSELARVLVLQQAFVGEIRQMLGRHRMDAEIHLGGPSMIVSDMVDAVRQDLIVFGLAALLILTVVLAICLRRLLWVALPLVCSLLVVLIMVGVLGWADWKVTVISSNFVVLVMILTLSLCVHLMVRHRELERTMPQASPRDLARETTKQMFTPCLFSALTTGVAFGSLLVSDIKPVIEFGRMMMVGISVALLVVFTLCPAILTLVPRPAGRPVSVNLTDDVSHSPIAQVLSSIAIKGKSWLVVGCIVAAGVLAYGALQLKVDNRFIDYFKSSTEIFKGMDLIDRNFGGTVPMSILIQAPAAWSGEVPVASSELSYEEEEDEELDEFLLELEDNAGLDFDQPSEGRFSDAYWLTGSGINELKRIQASLDKVSGLGKRLSILSFIQIGEQVNRAPLNDLEISLFANNLPADMADQLFNPLISADGDEIHISTRVVESTRDLNRADLLHQTHQALLDAGLSEDRFSVLGLAVLYSNTLQSLYSSLQSSLLTVSLAVFLMLWVLFRSLRVAILATLSNLLVAVTVLGAMGLSGTPLDFHDRHGGFHRHRHSRRQQHTLQLSLSSGGAAPRGDRTGGGCQSPDYRQGHLLH